MQDAMDHNELDKRVSLRLETATGILLLLLRSQAINSCGHCQSQHVSQNTTYIYLTLGVDFCVYGPFF